MPPIKPLEIYRLLNKSNCRKCRSPSCMAFAFAVGKGDKTLDDCPFIDTGTIEGLGMNSYGRGRIEEGQQELIIKLKSEVTKIDFMKSQERLDARLEGDKLAINCLGKDFLIDKEGNMASECHINPWVYIPLLSYIIYAKGINPSGDWISFSELKGGVAWNNYFFKRVEEVLKEIVDSQPELFFDIITVLDGREGKGILSADQSYILNPMPKVPFLFCYWMPEEDFESNFKIYFDTTANANLNIDSIYALARGLVEMFQRLRTRHIEGRIL